MKRLGVVLIVPLMTLAFIFPAQAALIQSKGKLTFLRVHDVGTGFGPPQDFIDSEVVIRLDTVPDRAMGFQLREDENRSARQGMLNLLRDAFNNNWTVTVDYDIDLDAGATNGVIIRVALSKEVTGSGPDLAPDNPSNAVQLCNLNSEGNLIVSVKNLGSIEAPASTTRVEFLPGGSITLPTPAIPAGDSVDLTPLDIPSSCFNADCNFRITVDIGNEVEETREFNNTAAGLCIG
jgi:hypothetical protein